MKYLITDEQLAEFHVETIHNNLMHDTEIYDFGLFGLSVQWGGLTDSGRLFAKVFEVDERPLGGYIGLSWGDDDEYHIGSPNENRVLQAVAEHHGWKCLS